HATAVRPTACVGLLDLNAIRQQALQISSMRAEETLSGTINLIGCRSTEWLANRVLDGRTANNMLAYKSNQMQPPTTPKTEVGIHAPVGNPNGATVVAGGQKLRMKSPTTV